MGTNRGTTSLKTKRRARHPMQDYDRLPPQLRAWVSEAMLPWRAVTVQRAYDKALSRVGTHDRALRELDRIQRNLVAKDAVRIWGANHPVIDQIQLPRQGKWCGVQCVCKPKQRRPRQAKPCIGF